MLTIARVTGLLLHLHGRCACVAPEAPGAPALLLFSGTQTYRDLWVDDLDVRPGVWPARRRGADGWTVHRGFARRTREILDDEARAFLEAHDRFVVGGHSLGGACAILAASDLQRRDGKQVDAVYVFGTPRLASRGFRAYYCDEQRLGGVTRSFATPRDPIVHRIPSVLYASVVPYEAVPCAAEDAWSHHDMRAYHAAWHPDADDS